ncbi:MAG: hypothetical protein IIC50_16630 [Planctomycetes bacterium]|nr:hypothetical protein [Planctomycetota bacterium]
MYSNRTIVAVLTAALLAFVLGHVMVAFLIAITMALLIASSAQREAARPELSDFADHDWSIAEEQHDIRVMCSACSDDDIMRFMAGRGHHIELDCRTVPFLPQCVIVRGRWQDPGGQSHHADLGHISRPQLQHLYQEFESHPDWQLQAKPSRMFTPSRTQTFPGLHIDVALMEPSLAQAC